MTKLIITPQKKNNNKHYRYQVFLDNQPVGYICADQEQLELDVPVGEHVLQVRSQKIWARSSNRLSITISNDNTVTVHIVENIFIYFGQFLGFCILYFALRTQLNMGVLPTAAISVMILYAVIAIIPALSIKKVSNTL